MRSSCCNRKHLSRSENDSKPLVAPQATRASLEHRKLELSNLWHVVCTTGSEKNVVTAVPKGPKYNLNRETVRLTADHVRAERYLIFKHPSVKFLKGIQKSLSNSASEL